MLKLIEKAETLVVYVLIVMLLVAVVFGTIDLGWLLVQTVLEPPFLLIDPAVLFESFGMFLVILIGLELLRLLKMHLSHHTLRPELVIEVAIIALCNKVVTLDIKQAEIETLLGLAGLLLALAAGYYVFAKMRNEAAGS